MARDSDYQKELAQKRWYWKKHVEAWRANGLTQAQYCRRHILKVHGLVYWRKKFVRQDPPPVPFVQIKLPDEFKLPQTAAIKIAIGSCLTSRWNRALTPIRSNSSFTPSGSCDVPVSHTRIYLAVGSTDMRKAINGLSILLEDRMELDPFSGHLFAFCNRRRNMIKILYWDRNGFCLYAEFGIKAEIGCSMATLPEPRPVPPCTVLLKPPRPTALNPIFTFVTCLRSCPLLKLFFDS